MSFRAQHHAALSQLAGLSSLSLSVPLVKFRLLRLASVFRSSPWHSTQRFHCVQSPPKLASTKLLKPASLIQPQGQRSFVNSISCHPPEHFRQAQEPTLPHPAHTCQIRLSSFAFAFLALDVLQPVFPSCGELQKKGHKNPPALLAVVYAHRVANLQMRAWPSNSHKK